MVESPPTSALKMTQADFLFEFLVVAFNAPPQLGRYIPALQWKWPHPGWRANILWVPVPPGPLDQQPFFLRTVAAPIIAMPFIDTYGGKSRGEHLVGAFPPGDGLICDIGQIAGCFKTPTGVCSGLRRATSVAAHSPNTLAAAMVLCPAATPGAFLNAKHIG